MPPHMRRYDSEYSAPMVEFVRLVADMSSLVPTNFSWFVQLDTQFHVHTA